MKSLYLIGSLRNKKVPLIANIIESAGYSVFDDWHAAGPEADDYWRKWAKIRNLTYQQALNSYSAKHVFEFDKYHLDRCDIAVLMMPAGRSGHLELGYFVGTGKPGFILFEEEPERWDVMTQFATGTAFSVDELLELLVEV